MKYSVIAALLSAVGAVQLDGMEQTEPAQPEQML